MSPRPFTALERPPVIPDVHPDRWWPTAAWHRKVDGRTVDAGRTADLDRFDDRVRSDGGVPLQETGPRNTTVLQSKPWWQLSKLPLPERVWLSDNGDSQWFGVDQAAGRYFEVSSLGPIWFGSWWRADSVRRYDLTKPWEDQGRSLTGAGVPLWPMIPTPQDLAKGSCTTALHLVMAGYSFDRPVGIARKTDGLDADHPVRAGEHLRLTSTALARLTGAPMTMPQSAVVWALRRYGCIATDQTSPTAGHNLRLPAGVNVDLPLRLTDLEVLVPT